MPPILPAPQRRLLGLIAFLVLSLTVYSALYDLSSQPTPSPSSAVDSLAGEGLLPSEWAEQKDDRGYFASKGNVLNQWFAKKAWAWTTIPFLAHAILHPHLPTSSTSRLRSLVKYFTATLYWAFLTIWAVGPSLFDRTMVYTGGECSVVVPRAVCERGEVDCAGAVSVGKGALMVVPREFCHLGKVSAQRLAAALSGYVVTGEENFRKETLEEWWSNLKPRWSGGHDVSGHVFLLTLSAVLLFGEVWPTLVLLRRTGWNFARVGVRGYVAVGGALIVGLWVFILTQTSIWFHTVLEKMTGLAVAAVGIGLVQLVGSFV